MPPLIFEGLETMLAQNGGFFAIIIKMPIFIGSHVILQCFMQLLSQAYFFSIFGPPVVLIAI